MPDPIGPYGVLHRARGKTPAFRARFIESGELWGIFPQGDCAKTAPHGDELGIGAVSYFMSDDSTIIPADFRAGACSPTIIQRSTPASPIDSLRSMRRGKPTMINFPAKKSVPQAG